MLSINILFENNTLVIQETLIDNLFNYIDVDIIKNEIGVNDFIKLKQEFKNTFHINIEFRLNEDSNDKTVNGKFIRPNTIILYLPVKESDRIKIKNSEIINVFLHEFSHFITDNKLPELVKIKTKKSNFKYNKLLPPPVNNVIFEEDDIEKIKYYLDYIFQLSEMPNFALSIALSILDFYHTKDTKQIFVDNKNIIEQNNNQVRDEYYWFLKGNIKLLFQVQYFVSKMKSKFYIQRLIKFRDLIEKYRRRMLNYYGGIDSD